MCSLIPETKEQMVLFDFDSMVRKEKYRHSQMVGHFLCRTVMRHRNWCVENAKKICEATDVYAIGAIAFYKLFGRTPNAMDSAVGAIYDFSGMKWRVGWPLSAGVVPADAGVFFTGRWRQRFDDVMRLWMKCLKFWKN